MKRLIIRARNLVSFWQSFGLRGTFDIVRGRIRADPLFSVHVAACQRPLWIRHDFTDLIVLKQAIEFRKGFLPRGFVPRTVLDLGANVGMTPSIFAARWPDARVVAVEPEPQNFELLRRNCSPAPNITTVNGAVWVCDRDLEIINPAADAWSFQVGESVGSTPQARKIPGFTMRTLMRHHALENLDVVKMDIEGAEKEIFESNPDQWLPQVRVLIVELHDRMRPGCSDALTAATANLPHMHFKHGEYDVFHFSRTLT